MRKYDAPGGSIKLGINCYEKSQNTYNLLSVTHLQQHLKTCRRYKHDNNFFKHYNLKLMKKAFLLVDFKTVSDPNLFKKASTVFTSMTGNKNFTKPAPTLAVLNAATNKFSNAMALAKDGDRMKIGERKTQRDALLVVMLQLVDYVTFTAKGDRLILMSSGFTVSAETKTARTMGKMKGFNVVQGENSGELAASVDRVKNADSYVFYYGLTPIVNDSWKSMPTGRLNYCNIPGLERGKEYSVRVVVVGPKGKTLYSDIRNIIVT